MQGDSPDRDLAQVEALLESSRPVPRPAFTADLERRLFDAPRRSPALRWRPGLAGAAAAAGLAGVLAVMGLAGTGPLSGDGPSNVQAGDNCRYVTVTGPTRVPHVVERADGKLDIRFTRERAEHIVKRCP